MQGHRLQEFLEKENNMSAELERKSVSELKARVYDLNDQIAEINKEIQDTIKPLQEKAKPLIEERNRLVGEIKARSNAGIEVINDKQPK